jgi:hypothetical protein
MLKILTAIVKECNYSIEVLKELNLNVLLLNESNDFERQRESKEGDFRIRTSRIRGSCHSLTYVHYYVRGIARRFQEVVVAGDLMRSGQLTVAQSPMREQTRLPIRNLRTLLVYEKGLGISKWSLQNQFSQNWSGACSGGATRRLFSPKVSAGGCKSEQTDDYAQHSAVPSFN